MLVASREPRSDFVFPLFFLQPPLNFLDELMSMDFGLRSGRWEISDELVTEDRSMEW